MVLTCTLRKWNPRPACGTAFSSVCISISVFGLVPTRDEPAECRGPVERGFVVVSLALETKVSGADSRWLTPQEVGCLSHLWNSKLAHAFT